MRIGIIGLPQAGKTTVFNALTHGNQPTVYGGGQFEVHTAVVNVPDERIDKLSEMFNPKKTTYAQVTYADIGGLEGKSDQSNISGQLLTQLSQMDGFVHVVRCFESAVVPHPFGSVDPLRDLQAMRSEMILSDLIHVEKKLERLDAEMKKSGSRDKNLIEKDIAFFESLQEALMNDQPLRMLDFSEPQLQELSGFSLLTLKPELLLFNTSDGQTVPCIEYQGSNCEVVTLQGKLEMEIAQLSPEEEAVFLEEYGIEETGLERVIRGSYCLIGLQSFFTVGEDEVRAWTIKKDATAVEAAKAIHSDLQKGFIRAEVISYDELMEVGGMTAAREMGKLRLEGKDYIVQDGDIVHFRFNV
jgi:GTP-binding protein YchF